MANSASTHTSRASHRGSVCLSLHQGGLTRQREARPRLATALETERGGTGGSGAINSNAVCGSCQEKLPETGRDGDCRTACSRRSHPKPAGAQGCLAPRRSEGPSPLKLLQALTAQAGATAHLKSSTYRVSGHLHINLPQRMKEGRFCCLNTLWNVFIFARAAGEVGPPVRVPCPTLSGKEQLQTVP